jgi:hypothetical protein
VLNSGYEWMILIKEDEKEKINVKLYLNEIKREYTVCCRMYLSK